MCTDVDRAASAHISRRSPTGSGLVLISGTFGRDGVITDLTTADLAAVGCRTLVVAGDDDIVTLEHSVELYRSLGDASLAVVPEASHLLLHEKPGHCTRLVADFLTAVAAPTLMPIRRAALAERTGVQAGAPSGRL